MATSEGETLQDQARTRRNVLLVMVDQWRADCMAFLGARHLKTPAVDGLCRDGVTFTNHVTTTVPCGPARASLLTGLYQMNHRAAQNTVPLNARHVTLARALRDLGYDPALVGYTTTTPDPTAASPRDPRFFGLGDVMDGFKQVGSFGAGMEGYFGWLAQKGFPIPERREDIWLPEGTDDVAGATHLPARVTAELSDSAFFTERALSYLKGRNGKPFFLHLGYWRPHPPFVASAPYHAMYRPEDMTAPVRAATVQEEALQHKLLDFYLRTTQQGSFFEGGNGPAAAMDVEAIRQMRATYFGLMTEVDDCLARVFAYLKESGQWDDTLVIFTSDHGEQLGDHHLLGKIGYFDESFRIPLVVRDPRAAPDARGRSDATFTESIDVMPTIIDWLGGEPPTSCDGRSLLPVLAGKPPADWRTELHYEYDFRDVYYSSPERDLGLRQDECSLCVVQDDKYKYVHFAALPPLFFDLTADPHQFRNVAEQSQYVGLVRDYAQKALSWRLVNADRSLDRYRSGPNGLETRPDPRGNTSQCTESLAETP